MLHLLMGTDPWFRAKRYGYGAGLPVKWQGWVLIASYVAVLGGIGLISKSADGFTRAFAFTVFLAVTVIFLSVLNKRTEGGFKWRWGNRESH
jgi:hypothetical protein